MDVPTPQDSLPKEPRLPQTFTVTLSDAFYTRLLRLFFVAAILWFLFGLVAQITGVLLTLAIAVLITAVLEPLVSFFEQHGINRIGAILIVFILLFLGLSVLIRLASPVINEQVSALSAALSNLERDPGANFMQSTLDQLSEKLPFLNAPFIRESLNTKIDESLTTFLKILFSGVLSLLTSFPYLIIITFAVFFFLKDGWRIKRAFISAMPNRYFEMALIILDKTTSQLSRYIQGQFVVAFAVGLLSSIALTVLDVRYSVFIGTIAGIANMIPYFGPIAGAIPAIVMGLLGPDGGFGLVMAIIGAFAAIQLIENVLISPFVVSRSVELHPLLILVAILIGQALAGIWGMLIAVPLTSILKVIGAEIKWGLENYRLSDSG